ncbi:polyphosphate kinase 1 [Phragmitibacter flavus]|uniref:Polyphosphate kinase n=1 Tax=Phragmitibacter flavus TaxID=2576071 RepID=A0A5R8K7E9_9BACT|nr:polyphosphate kinase 1 [Phragmitibacter flavus]TLD68291.1 polyphosphate kinase 1 [Phragmitibacter flavus]
MSPENYINRELSWLSFNERVLEEATRETLPVLERVKFLAITAANLDEFYMVRVGGLQFLKDTGKRVKDTSGLTPSQQLTAIRERTLQFIDKQYTLLNQDLLPALRNNGIHRVLPNELTPAQRTYLQDYFNEQISPVLSPIAIEPDEPPIVLPALLLILMSEIHSQTVDKKPLIRRAIFILPTSLPRHIALPSTESGTHAYINIEDVVELYLHTYFPKERVVGTARFRISRNSDITLDDQSALDIAAEMEDILDARKTSGTIRLEIEQETDVTPSLVKAIQQLCQTTPAHTYLIPGELDLRAYFSIAGISGFEKLKTETWPTAEIIHDSHETTIFDTIRGGDLLLHHPYESFEPVMQLLEQAAADPNVIAIKQILYRTAKNSRIISALVKAAQAGKHVTVLVELRARFDEARNLERAEDLLNAGAQIIYGVRGLKTHAKITLIMRREAGRMMRYCHFGTGNYNEATSKLYTDISYLTCRPQYGADASAFFNTVTGRSRFVHFNKISMAPFGLRERLVELIESEAERARHGETASMMLKMNSLEDPQMIDALYAASKAGVKILLSVRGICCLRPGVKGLSENIRVISIIDRYLEHARIFWFSQGSHPVVLIASADFMNRNLSKRVELLTPIEDPEAKETLHTILKTQFNDNTQARELNKDGTYTLIKPPAKTKAFRSQEYFAKQAVRRHRPRAQSPDILVPHLPK